METARSLGKSLQAPPDASSIRTISVSVRLSVKCCECIKRAFLVLGQGPSGQNTRTPSGSAVCTFPRAA